MFRFTDGETIVSYDETVRGKHVFVVQSCAAPISDSIVELLQLISAARGSGAERVTAVVPYFAYRYHRYTAAHMVCALFPVDIERIQARIADALIISKQISLVSSAGHCKDVGGLLYCAMLRYCLFVAVPAYFCC